MANPNPTSYSEENMKRLIKNLFYMLIIIAIVYFVVHFFINPIVVGGENFSNHMKEMIMEAENEENE